ncbi:hypothetical protein U1Q18_047487 [Sarracenia purpurea var. burkii]
MRSWVVLVSVEVVRPSWLLSLAAASRSSRSLKAFLYVAFPLVCFSRILSLVATSWSSDHISVMWAGAALRVVGPVTRWLPKLLSSPLVDCQSSISSLSIDPWFSFGVALCQRFGYDFCWWHGEWLSKLLSSPLV